ncbi:helix-turn-helix domain-containing protein [Paenibacillus luteus]|uniref:helix-turn-helix domain-containing protein n=1 Tax=Paenibacillus luteus TaxID=2545753 RepID=UPI001143AB27|nr:helix-turn-helix domain-containing protein [Paenibacillus luteus]
MRADDLNEFLHSSCKLLLESLQLPVFYTLMNGDDGIHSFSMNEIQSNPLFDNQSELVQFLKPQVLHSNVPNIHTTNFGESFIIVPLLQEGAEMAIVVIGPAVTLRMTDEIIQDMLRDFNITETLEWTSYLLQLPLLSSKRLYHIGILSYHLLNGVMLDVTDITETKFQFEQPTNLKKHAEIVISDRRESLEFRDLFEIEKQLLRSIRNGDKTAFYNMTLSTNFDGPGILSNYSQLRNIKNLGIYVIALATRAGIEGGLYPEIGYTLSDLHIQYIEELRDYRAVVNAIGDALIDFVDRVSECKRKHLSKSIATCQEYIFNHLYENIPLSHLADKVGLQENYLSQLFKKETGVTITQFIQQEKVEEAKKLLELTSDPIATIAAKLNFYDQNHFIKIFKRYIGLTPKRYRNKNKFDI